MSAFYLCEEYSNCDHRSLLIKLPPELISQLSVSEDGSIDPFELIELIKQTIHHDITKPINVGKQPPIMQMIFDSTLAVNPPSAKVYSPLKSHASKNRQSQE